MSRIALSMPDELSGQDGRAIYIMALLTQFLLRLSFGMAIAMATVSPRQVTSGYFRNHLYVILGLTSLASLLSRAAAPAAFGWALATATLSYVGAVAWLYEKRTFGIVSLVILAITALAGALSITDVPDGIVSNEQIPFTITKLALVLRIVQTITSGVLIGITMAAMLLGHWYLNSPGMELRPLRKLLVAMAIAVIAQAVVCGIGLSLENAIRSLSTQDWLFLTLRWSFGLIGVIILIWLTWQTLAIPNTQSATGILYVAVMGVFVGETMSLLLSAESVYPV
jgi:hypothetical protein